MKVELPHFWHDDEVQIKQSFEHSVHEGGTTFKFG
jgi:hypothetical protein